MVSHWNQMHDSRFLSKEEESLANSLHKGFTSKGDNSTPASDDSIPTLPLPMPPLSLLKGAMGPESSVLPAKNPHVSPAASKRDDTFIVDCQPANLTCTKCPAWPQHLDVFIPLACGSLPSPSSARKEATTTTQQSCSKPSVQMATVTFEDRVQQKDGGDIGWLSSQWWNQ